MKKILVIAPNSYPVDSAEAIVNIKFIKALSDDGGFEIDLISKKNSHFVYPSDSIESYGIKLHSLHIIENQGGFSFRVLYESLCTLFVFRCIFPGCHWAYRALPIVKEMVNTNHYDFVVTKNSPSYLLGARLKQKNGLKWVASWNDPYPGRFYPIPYGKGKDHKQSIFEKIELRLMRKANYHVFPTKELRDYMKSYMKIPDQLCFVAPHVVNERENIINSNLDVKNKNNATILRIIHSGSLLAPRSCLPVINAISRIVKERPDVKINFTIVGKIEESENKYISSLSNLSDVVTILPTVEYKKSLELLAEHDVACVIEASCKVGEGVFLPTKVTDFMQSHKPIIAVSPKGGVLEGLYKDNAIGYFADVHDESSIVDGLLLIWEDYLDNKLKESRVPSYFLPKSVIAVYNEIYQSNTIL